MSHENLGRDAGSRARDFFMVGLVYVASMAVLGLVLANVSEPDGLEAAFTADLAATLVIFTGSVLARNASMYDAYWSVLPIALVTIWAVQSPADVPRARALLVVAGVWFWGLRLTWNWARGWHGLHEEDWRYVMLRRQTGAAYPLVNLLGIHVFPTVQVFAGLVPAWFALRSSAPLGVLDAVAALVLFGAVTVEMVADLQLAAFVASKPPEGSVMETGLWRWSRHPNYFGEIGFWLGLFAFGAAAGGPLWTVTGFSAITGMFVFISIPMMERRQLERRPAYRRVLETTSMLIPLPRRRPGPR